MAGTVHVLDAYYLAITAFVTVAYQLIGFSIAFTFKFDKITDLFGGTNFIILSILTLALGGVSSPLDNRRNIIASVFVMIWGARLSGFLLFRILKTGTDTRFDDKRGNFFKFLGFWVFQAVWVWVVSLPLTIGNSPAVNNTGGHSFGTASDIVGIIMWVIGFFLEAVGDIQKFRFKQGQHDKSNFMHSGVWSWSRHPNYMGEILLWFGIYTMLLAPAEFGDIGTNPRAAVYASILGPIFLALLLLFVSGIPLQDKPAAKKRFEEGNNYEGYRGYLESTSILIPLPPQVYRPIPSMIKKSLLLDFPFFNFHPNSSMQGSHGSEQA